jgi:hypothetical protein
MELLIMILANLVFKMSVTLLIIIPINVIMLVPFFQVSFRLWVSFCWMSSLMRLSAVLPSVILASVVLFNAVLLNVAAPKYITNFIIVNFLCAELIIWRMNDESPRVRLHVRFQCPIPYCVLYLLACLRPCGLYYEHVTIVNYASIKVNSLKLHLITTLESSFTIVICL